MEAEFVIRRIKFRGEELIISKHALERFIERWPQANPRKPLGDPIQALAHLLEFAEEGRMSKGGRVRRIINNNFKPAVYFYNRGWRFVLSDDEPKTLLTVERNIFGRRKHMYPAAR